MRMSEFRNPGEIEMAKKHKANDKNHREDWETPQVRVTWNNNLLFFAHPVCWGNLGLQNENIFMILILSRIWNGEL